MPLTPYQKNLLADIADAEPDSKEETDALQFIANNDINFEDELFCWTPLITAIQYKRDKITDALLAKGADIYHVSQQGTTALATAIAVQNSRMIAFLHPQYKTRWPKGEDRILVEQLVGLIDEYYPTDKVKSDTDIRDERASLIPWLNACRRQPIPLTAGEIELIQRKISQFQAWLEERDLATQKQQMLASLIVDEKKREAFLKKDQEMRIMALEEENRARAERAALEQELKKERARREELEAKQKLYEAQQQKAQAEQGALVSRQEKVEAKVSDVASQLKVLALKVEALWYEHETEQEVKTEKEFIRSRPSLLLFYRHTQSKLNDLFSGRSAARSGELVAQEGGAGAVSAVINLAGDIIPIPGAKLISSIVGALTELYAKYKKGQRDQRLDKGLKGMASGQVEWETEITEPAARATTLAAREELPKFPEAEIQKLGEVTVRLMLIYVMFEYNPQQSPAPTYAEIIRNLLLAVRFKQAGQVKDIHGRAVKPKTLITLSGEQVPETRVVAAFHSERPVFAKPPLPEAPPLARPVPKAPMAVAHQVPVRPSSPPPVGAARSVSPAPRVTSNKVKEGAPSLPVSPRLPQVAGRPNPLPAAALAPPLHLVPPPLTLTRSGGLSPAPAASMSLTMLE